MSRPAQIEFPGAVYRAMARRDRWKRSSEAPDQFFKRFSNLAVAAIDGLDIRNRRQVGLSLSTVSRRISAEQNAAGRAPLPRTVANASHP
jgi:hypothetical protein